MEELEKIKRDIQEIKERNSRVNLDKAWETSFTRKFLISLLTYVVSVTFFIQVDFPRPFLSAIVPTVGFILSTLSISFFKKLWIKNLNKFDE